MSRSIRPMSESFSEALRLSAIRLATYAPIRNGWERPIFRTDSPFTRALQPLQCYFTRQDESVQFV